MKIITQNEKILYIGIDTLELMLYAQPTGLEAEKK